MTLFSILEYGLMNNLITLVQNIANQYYSILLLTHRVSIGYVSDIDTCLIWYECVFDTSRDILNYFIHFDHHIRFSIHSDTFRFVLDTL
jgi:hypothetical protein